MTGTDAAIIEPILRELIAAHGAKAVADRWAELMPGVPWTEWQMVHSMTRRLAKRAAGPGRKRKV